MIDKLAGVLGRRGVIKGALGLGAAVGLGVPQRQTSGYPPVGGWVGPGSAGPLTKPPEPVPEPDWLKAIEARAGERQDELFRRPKFDGLDLELATLRSPSPAWKLATQRSRERAREREMQTWWDRLRDARDKWMRSLTR